MTAQWRMRARMQFLNPTSKLAAKQSIIHNHKGLIGRKRGDLCKCHCRQKEEEKERTRRG